MTDYSSQFYKSTDGLRLHYRDYNNAPAGAPTILCMPGLTRNARDFADIATLLSSEYRVLCAEQRGRGSSQWDNDPTRYRPDVYVGDMAALLEHAGVDKFIAFGTSLGGLMTMMMAVMMPGKLLGAIINDIGPEVDPAGIARIKGYVGKGTPPKTWDEAIAAAKASGPTIYPTFNDADWKNFTEKLFVEVDGVPVPQYDPAISKNFDGEANSQNAPDLWPVFEATYSIPMVVIRGALSDILSAETLQKMAALHPDLTPVTVPNKGHAPVLDEPECVEAVQSLLKKCA